MRVPLTLLLFLICAALIPPVWAQMQEGQDQKPPEGTETIQIGGNQILLPKGAVVKRIGAQLIIESDTEYMGRKLSGMEDRIQAVEAKQEELNRKIEAGDQELKQKLESLQETLSALQVQVLTALSQAAEKAAETPLPEESSEE